MDKKLNARELSQLRGLLIDLETGYIANPGKQAERRRNVHIKNLQAMLKNFTSKDSEAKSNT